MNQNNQSGWPYLLARYIGKTYPADATDSRGLWNNPCKTYICPSGLMEKKGSEEWGKCLGYMILRDYSRDRTLFKLSGLMSKARTKNKHLSNLCIFVDNDCTKANPYVGRYYERIGVRHGGRANLCAVDGSVKAIKPVWYSSKSSWALPSPNRLE